MNKYTDLFKANPDKGSEEYAKKIIGRINPEDVDSISGATYSYNQFTDAVYDALDKAAE